MIKKRERSAARSIGQLGLVNIALTVVGILQAFVVGWLYGTTIGIEIYFAALTFYQAMVNLLQTGQISEVFTPMYHRLKKSHDDVAAQRLFSMLTNWMASLAIVLAGLAYFLATFIVPYIVPGFDVQRTQECVAMFCWIIPLASVQVCLSLVTCFLAAEKRFVGPEITRLVSVLIGLTTIVALSSWLGAWAMVAGLWVTNLCSAIGLFSLAFRAGYRHHFRFLDSEISIAPLFRSLPSIFSYVLVTQLYSVALTSGLSTLPQGSLAVFTYARRIYSRINGLLARPISVVFFNYYSADLIDRPEKTRALIHKSLRLSLLAATFVSVAVIASAYPGLKMLWLNERFPVQNVWLTYLILSALCLTAFFGCLGIIYRKINMTHQLISHQYRLLCLVQIVCCVLAYRLIAPFGLWAAVAIVLINPCLMATASAFLSRLKVPKEFTFYRIQDIAKCVLIMIIGIAPALACQHFVGETNNRLGNGLTATLCVSLSLGLALGTSLWLRLEEPLAAVRLFRNRLMPQKLGSQ